MPPQLPAQRPEHGDTPPGQTAAPDISRAALQLLGRALAQRWPITADMRARIIHNLHAIATNPGECGTREAVSAAKALILADRLNRDDEADRRRDPQPVLIPIAPGVFRPDFSAMTDEQLEDFLAR